MTQEYLLSVLETYRYAVLFPIAFLEGPILSVMVGFLVSAGFIKLLPSFGILMFADVVRDVASYYVGKWWHPKFAVTRLGKRMAGMDRLWHEHTFKAMMLAKWSYGLSFPLLISAGLAKIPVRSFIINALFATTLQYAVLMAVGYYFGESYEVVGTYIVNAQIAVAIGLVLVIAGIVAFSKFVRKELPSES